LRIKFLDNCEQYLILYLAISTVYHEADSPGSKSDNGSWSGILALVSSGIAHVGVESFTVTKERSEVVAYTNAIESAR
jgi:hypothetical protein